MINFYKKKGASDFVVFIVIAAILVIAIFIAPKFIKNKSSQKKEVKEQTKSNVPYVGVYNKGMSGAKKAVDASNERNSLVK